MSLGVIGTGRIGSMLATALAVAAPNAALTVYNRTWDKAETLANAFPETIRAVRTLDEAIDRADQIFLCLRPNDLRTVMHEIGNSLRKDQWVISTCSSISLCELETFCNSLVCKLIPSVTQRANAGVALVMFSERWRAHDRSAFVDTLSCIGRIHTIAEEDVRIYSDLTSCAPAFFSHLAFLFQKAACQKGVDMATAQMLIAHMMEGLGALVASEIYNFTTVIERVAVPGGVTEAGLTELMKMDESLFDRVLDATARRQREILDGGQH
ncbi:pyrroline-5-carboxylate reductase dimerization domain-containing protein [Ferroacidibacillus organovorans]|uniref:Pyrroline-5-carboxylate reductase n=1 Tax=Ferroacidibacillus organovorans TaxID=1765683 RepID=A0A853K8Y3_9BACL|nr:pyrroline-5-carboxylate reductase dimerization domain-containing protein [Ferroacidibacillus organovorans]KYP80410.1 hypothetical protein AYJ22_11155 [Ferroacidibacillus organovorans]OAG93522.1 hypothetical protein AYW79_10125 [Ferroacidibacillus organovorans]